MFKKPITIQNFRSDIKFGQGWNFSRTLSSVAILILKKEELVACCSLWFLLHHFTVSYIVLLPVGRWLKIAFRDLFISIFLCMAIPIFFIFFAVRKWLSLNLFHNFFISTFSYHNRELVLLLQFIEACQGLISYKGWCHNIIEISTVLFYRGR